jgi:prolyl oligopeptidase
MSAISHKFDSASEEASNAVTRIIISKLVHLPYIEAKANSLYDLRLDRPGGFRCISTFRLRRIKTRISMSKRSFALLAPVALALLLPALSNAADGPPVAPVKPVTDTYFGTEVIDNYRYLEDLKDPQVQEWMKAQAKFTRDTLDRLPGRAGLLERIHALSNTDTRRAAFIMRGQRYFYLMIEPGAQQPKLFYRDGLKGEEHLLIDPAAISATGTHYALDYYTPSWDGKLMVYGLSAGGSEESVLHVMDVATGKILPEAIDRTNNDQIAWRPDNKSFFYLRYVKPGPNVPQAELLYNARTYLHTLGARMDGEGDPVVFGRGVSKLDVPEGQGTYITVAEGSGYAIAAANHNMDSNPSTLYVAPLDKIAGANTPWKKFADVEDGITAFDLRGDKLYFLSQKGASRFRLLATSLKNPDVKHPQVIIPEGKGILTDFGLAKEGIYVRQRDGAVSHLLRVSFDGKENRAVNLPFDGNLFGPTTDPKQPGALFNMQSWVRAPQVYFYDPASDATANTGLSPPSKIDTSQLESKEVFAVSYDGTRVPLSIIYKKGMALDGTHPTILDGYGSYGLVSESFFNRSATAWVERGGVFAIAHIRGGGEYGEDWHTGAQFRTKTNTVFDFIACGEYLVDEKYTSSRYLAASGGSAGGITVGGAMTWRPELFHVILDQVGMSDTMRMETEPNGPPNISEFGTVKTEDGFHGLYGMGAYHHVRDGTPYPAVIFVTGANDPRVSPWHMMKMAARVQAASSSGLPVLLRIDYDAGHGIGSNASQREIVTADMWSFALWQMGDAAFQPK